MFREFNIMIEKTIVLEKLYRNPDGRLVNKQEKEFNAKAFSRFKYGSQKETEHFARLLSERIREEKLEMAYSLISSANYKNIPSAAAHLTHAVVRLMNAERVSQKKEEIPLIKIHRVDVFEGDYSQLPKKKRKEMMKKTRLAVPSEVKGKHVIVIDDVKVSGAHENRLRQALREAGASRVTYVYLAYIEGSPEGIEDMLNQASVKTLDDLKKIMLSENYLLTSRAVKFILSEKDLSVLSTFLEDLPPDLLIEIAQGSVANGFDQMPLYKTQAELISIMAKKKSGIGNTKKVEKEGLLLNQNLLVLQNA